MSGCVGLSTGLESGRLGPSCRPPRDSGTTLVIDVGVPEF